MLHKNILHQDQDNCGYCQHSLHQPHFHHNGCLFHPFVLKEMMKWSHGKELSFKHFFPKNLQSTRTKFNNKYPKNNYKRNNNSEPHIEQID